MIYSASASMIKIPLSQGLFAQVDDDDALLVRQFKWCATVAPYNGKFYASTNIRMGKGKHTVIGMHRLLSGASHGVSVDHKDLDPLNNQRENLRLCTGSQNQGNRLGHSKRGFPKGVQPSKGGRYQATITCRYKKQSLGVFDTIEEAKAAYREAALKCFGEFARWE